MDDLDREEFTDSEWQERLAAGEASRNFWSTGWGFATEAVIFITVIWLFGAFKG